MPLAKILNSWEKCEIQSFSWPLWWSLPACLLSVPGQRARGPDSALLPPHTMQPILKPPLVYALLIKGAAKSPTIPSPSPHTHTPTQTHTQQNSWNCSDWRGPLRKQGHREWGETTTEKKNEWKRVKHLQNQSLWIPLAAQAAVVLLHAKCPPCPLCCLLPTLETMTVIIEGENRGGDRERGTGIRKGGLIVNERAAHPGTPMPNSTGKHWWKCETLVGLLFPNLCFS